MTKPGVFCRYAAILLVALASLGARAEEVRPDELVRRLTNEVLAAIQSDAELRAGDREKALALAEEKVLPYVDFRRMTALAVGRSWRNATPQQRDELTRQFRTLLVRTYSNAISAYKGQTMTTDPLNMQPGETDVTVRNRYLRPGKPPLRVDYSMHRTPDGWKAYDIVVGGVSLVATYRSTFDELAQRAGVDGLILALQQMNGARASLGAS